MAIGVSVVVPVYNPGEHIDGLLASLRRQSMPDEQFEVVFVDDGSTDGTGERLDRLAAQTKNMRVIHIPNSGWPGKPRNVGIDAARGEYVLFVDNDDELGDQALQRLYAYAVENDSDVVIGREIRRPGRPTWGPLFRVNRPRASLEHDPLLALLTPHKLFRRAFLDEHGIRFFEGPRRLEDHPFVVKAYFRAKVISILSDYTCYYWVTRKDRSNAGLRPPEWSTWYTYLRDALDVVEENTAPGESRDRLLSHWYRSKGLVRLGPGLTRRTEDEARELLEALHELAEERFPPSVDAHLPGIMRVRSALLRAREFGRIRALAEVEAGMRLEQTLEPLEARGGHLVVKATANVTYANGDPVVLDPVGARLYWRTPIDLGPHVAREALDFTEEHGRTGLVVAACGRSSNEAFQLPGESEPLPPQADGTRLLGAWRNARIAPATLMNGRPMSVEVWDLHVQLATCGWAPTRPLQSPPGAPRRAPLGPALAQARLVLPFTTVRGTVALDVGQRSLAVPRVAAPATSEARLQPTPRGVRLVVPLTGLTVQGRRHIGRLRLHPEDGGQAATRPLRLVGDGAAVPVRLVADVPLVASGGREGVPAGHWRLSAATRGVVTQLDLQLAIHGNGSAALRTADGETISETGSRLTGWRRRLRRVPGAATAARAARRAGRVIRSG